MQRNDLVISAKPQWLIRIWKQMYQNKNVSSTILQIITTIIPLPRSTVIILISLLLQKMSYNKRKNFNKRIWTIASRTTETACCLCNRIYNALISHGIRFLQTSNERAAQMRGSTRAKEIIFYFMPLHRSANLQPFKTEASASGSAWRQTEHAICRYTDTLYLYHLEKELL